jgi:hypothetical protein
VVSFTLWPLYPRYPLDRRLGGPQSRSGSCEEGKNLLHLPIIKPRPSSLLPWAVPTPIIITVKRQGGISWLISFPCQTIFLIYEIACHNSLISSLLPLYKSRGMLDCIWKTGTSSSIPNSWQHRLQVTLPLLLEELAEDPVTSLLLGALAKTD